MYTYLVQEVCMLLDAQNAIPVIQKLYDVEYTTDRTVGVRVAVCMLTMSWKGAQQRCAAYHNKE